MDLGLRGRVALVSGAYRGTGAGIARVLAAAGRHSLPVNLMGWGRLEQAGELARRHPGTRVVIDHLGLPQPFTPPPPAQPFAALPSVLALAQHRNIAIKISGACTLSHEPFPYRDLWDPLGRIFDAFGLERCLWGTDWTRAAAVVNYAQAVEPFRTTTRLSESERAMLMGGACAKAYRWQPKR